MPRLPRFKIKFIKVPWLKNEPLVSTEKRTEMWRDNDFFGSLVSEMKFRRKK